MLETALPHQVSPEIAAQLQSIGLHKVSSQQIRPEISVELGTQ